MFWNGLRRKAINYDTKKEIDISKKKFARLKYKLYLCIVESSTTDRTGSRKTKK